MFLWTASFLWFRVWWTINIWGDICTDSCGIKNGLHCLQDGWLAKCIMQKCLQLGTCHKNTKNQCFCFKIAEPHSFILQCVCLDSLTFEGQAVFWPPNAVCVSGKFIQFTERNTKVKRFDRTMKQKSKDWTLLKCSRTPTLQLFVVIVNLLLNYSIKKSFEWTFYRALQKDFQIVVEKVLHHSAVKMPGFLHEVDTSTFSKHAFLS